jgi:hypothetical protein
MEVKRFLSFRLAAPREISSCSMINRRPLPRKITDSAKLALTEVQPRERYGFSVRRANRLKVERGRDVSVVIVAALSGG